jgi:hypothetical protein
MCEQKNWEHIILDLDNDFLLNLALGNYVYVCDTSKKGRPRALWQGLEFIIYVLHKVWFGSTYKTQANSQMVPYFETEYKKLSRPIKNKIKYFRKFLNTTKLNLTCYTNHTENDNNYSYFKDILIDYNSNNI